MSRCRHTPSPRSDPQGGATYRDCGSMRHNGCTEDAGTPTVPALTEANLNSTIFVVTLTGVRFASGVTAASITLVTSTTAVDEPAQCFGPTVRAVSRRRSHRNVTLDVIGDGSSSTGGGTRLVRALHVAPA